ncbi:PREDICTED: laccase-7 isoform X2 [Tarenaya hassleriana]|uniref:laccase-7 isoform X2 n=1 Tax=Tarenaya hassleriana TaxID=28532 RepID=UPI00053C85FE|nr:PREDICTED: laccase-7 isoform X2 [Tarenaya hassleriana]
MEGLKLSLAWILLLLAASSMASAAIVEHTFHVKNLTVSRLCKRQVITAVNGSLPGPTLLVREGDTLVVHVVNQSPHNITIHWHGIFQRMSQWSDGPSMITQCPIQPGQKYTYRFTVTGQEGTLWWHAHASFLRATVYGALVIRPRDGHSYPFPKPDKEIPILLGEWWNADVVELENIAVATGVPPNNSDAYTINGLPGDLYPCSKDRMFSLRVVKGKRYLLRIINAAMNIQMFFKIANHKLTVVTVDAVYTNPYVTDVIVIAPGQTVDAILLADQSVGSYYMAARAYNSAPAVPFPNTTTRAVLHYSGGASTSTRSRPRLPSFFDPPTAHRFYSNLTSHVGARHWVPVPRHVDEEMLVTVGLGLEACTDNATCPNGPKFSASMNNHSFVLPTTLSVMQAAFYRVGRVFTADFPDQPPVKFDYTNPNITQLNPPLLFAPKKTSVKVLRFNATVEMVLQNTALVAAESHPMHLHGFNFHVLGQGFGNYDPNRDRKNLNFFDPQFRNTLAVPVGGWAVIRFTADNPGAWVMHCHIDVHLPFGLGMVFLVENGPTPSTMLPPPPPDLPQC